MSTFRVVVIAVVAALAGLLTTPAVADDDPLLPRATPGRVAARALGADLARAAARNDVSRADLTDLLADPSVWLDRDGRVFFRDQRAAGPSARQALPAAPFPSASTFALQSRPGSRRTIYLDFDGHSLVGTAWNTDSGVPARAYGGYDSDDNPGLFSATELAEIQEIWRRVADDYAPFDVNVTTAAPAPSAITRSGPSDDVYGTRAFISSDPSLARAACSGGCTGIAYLDVFDEAGSHDSHQPALVFALYGWWDAAETISHEVGHQLALQHDGWTDGVDGDEYYYGDNGWAPIMGSSPYPITQWSKGEYPGATNREDDVAVIADSGAPLRSDDFPDTAGTDTSAATVRTGVIGAGGDVDVVDVGTCSGTTTITATSEGDVDIGLSLLDASGSTIASDDPVSVAGYEDGVAIATGLDASITRSLPTGAYYARIVGVGRGTWATRGYGDYGSIGSWTLRTTCAVPDTPHPPSEVSATSTADGTGFDVSWSSPATGGPTRTGYEVLLDDVVVATPGETATRAAVGPVAPGTTHTIGVRSLAGPVRGEVVLVVARTSDPAGSVVIPPIAPAIGPPSAPRIGRPTSGAKGGSLTVTVRWSAAAANGSAVTSYQVIARRYRGSSVTKTIRSRPLGAGTRNYSMRLPKGTYRVTVRARNGAGWGPASAASRKVTAR